MILMKITLEQIMNLKNNSRRVIGRVLINNFPSNIFLKMPLSKIYPKNCQAFLAGKGMNGF